jgi:hypothetical protein
LARRFITVLAIWSKGSFDMSALLDIESSAVVPTALSDVARVTLPAYVPKVLSGLVYVPAPRIESVSLRILISDFNVVIDGAVVQLRQDKDAGKIFMKVEIDANVEASITFTGTMTEHGASFEIEEVSFRLAPTKDCARADFVASTINAALNLSQRVHLQMPESGLDLALGFDLPLIEISRLLQSRQTSFRLMTIERATGNRFDLPRDGFSGNEIGVINFVFRSIVERRFVFLLNSVQVYIEASEDGAERLKSFKESDALTFGPDPVTKSLLGVEIRLGRQTAKISEPFIEEFDRVQQEVLRRDGHLVPVMIRSLTNQAVYELPEAPSLPPDPWNDRIQRLIDLERDLDSRLFERYNALAAGSLAGLTEEEKELVTQSSEISYPTNES